MSYKDYLNSKNVAFLKDIIRNYMGHVKITVSGKKKSELIDHIIAHTDYQNGNIVSKASSIQKANVEGTKSPEKKVEKVKMAKTGSSMISGPKKVVAVAPPKKAVAVAPPKKAVENKQEKLKAEYAELEKKEKETYDELQKVNKEIHFRTLKSGKNKGKVVNSTDDKIYKKIEKIQAKLKAIRDRMKEVDDQID